MEKIKIAILPYTKYLSCEKEADSLSRIISVFGENEGERLKTINNQRARLASLGGLVALSSLVGDKGGIICRNECGKPYFKDSSLGHFSISHSGILSVAAYGGCEIGIDLERIDTSRDLKRIADRFFTERELDIFRKEGDTAESFFEIWTKKEAYVKYLGGAFASIFSKDIRDVILKSIRFEYDDGEYILTLCALDETEFEILSKDIRLKA